MANICNRVDRYLVAYLVSVGAGTENNVWPAKRSLSKSLPCTICWSHTANPPREDPYSGNRLVEAFIEVRTSGVIEESETEDEPQEASNDRVSLTFEAFREGDGNSSGDLGDAITTAGRAAGAGDLTVLSCREVGQSQGFNPRSPKLEGQAWVDVIHLQLLVAPSDVS